MDLNEMLARARAALAPIDDMLAIARGAMKPLDDVIEAARRAVETRTTQNWTLKIPGERP